jgi:hypothetical protein
MTISNSLTRAKHAIHFAHAVLALGMVMLMFGLKFQGPHGFVFLEGLALGLYGLVATVLEALALVLLHQNRHWLNKYVEFWNAFLWELHMVLLIATHVIIYQLFQHAG